MYELKKNGKVFTSKFVGTGHSSCEKKNLPGRGLTKAEKNRSRNSRSLNFLEPSGSVRACKGAGILLHLTEGRLDGRTVFRGVTLCRSAQRIQKWVPQPLGVFRGMTDKQDHHGDDSFIIITNYKYVKSTGNACC
jgi:hypothetical protein